VGENLVLRQAQEEVFLASEAAMALILSLSKDEDHAGRIKIDPSYSLTT